MKTQMCTTSQNHLWVYNGILPVQDHYCGCRLLDYLMQKMCSPTTPPITCKCAIVTCCSSNSPGSPDRPQSNIYVAGKGKCVFDTA